MTTESAYRRFLTEHGEQQFGTGDVLLSRADALVAVALAREEGLAILGGDVFEARPGGIEPAYANWHSSRRRGEGPDDYIGRTCREAAEFLRQYPEPADSEALFALVTEGAGRSR